MIGFVDKAWLPCGSLSNETAGEGNTILLHRGVQTAWWSREPGQTIKHRYGKAKRKVLEHSSHYSGGLNTLAPAQTENNFIDIAACRTGNHHLASPSISQAVLLSGMSLWE